MRVRAGITWVAISPIGAKRAATSARDDGLLEHVNG
jgi:hypothetical protein